MREKNLLGSGKLPPDLEQHFVTAGFVYVAQDASGGFHCHREMPAATFSRWHQLDNGARHLRLHTNTAPVKAG